MSLGGEKHKQLCQVRDSTQITDVFQPLNSTHWSSFCLGPWRPLCSQSCGCQVKVWEEHKNQFYFFLFPVFVVQVQSQGRPPHFCPGRSQLQLMPTASSQPQNEAWRQGHSYLWGSCVQRKTQRSFIIHPHSLPTSVAQGQDFEGSPRLSIFPGLLGLPVLDWGL